MTKKQTVQVAEARGRPMLHWVGKRPLDYVTAFPAQLVETFNPTGEELPSPEFGGGAGGGGLLFHGDNKDVLAWLLAHGYRGKVNLIYIDPPFDSGADYVRQVQLRSVKGMPKLEGEAHSLGEQVQYADIWANDMYLQFMYERLLLLKELLSQDGSIYLHCDWHKGHHLRCLMDEVFGAERFLNEIVWQRTASHNDPGRYGVIHDMILFYSKGDVYIWNDPKMPQSQDYIDQFFVYAESSTGEIKRMKKGEACPPGWRRFRLGNFASPHPRPNLMYEYKGYKPPATGWKVSIERMKELDEQGRLFFPESKDRRIQTKSYLDEVIGGKPTPDLWTDKPAIQAQSAEREDYPTQKPEALLERIIKASSNPGDLVLDCFVGSGTTTATAQKLGRRWIAADINKGSIHTTSKRLQTIIQEQVKKNQALPGMGDEDEAPPPVALSFSVYCVNDYDLQIQHNEAVNLAVELTGIERIKTDTFFDGTLGKRLVKIIPFNHPLTLLDLELLKDELEARRDEERDVVVVCLGKELAVDPWLEEYNKHRPINKIEVIELRTDQKYGKFFLHQPAQAQVQVERLDGKLRVEIEDFISPTIVERLEMGTPLFKAQIPDWRAMVDVVLIDTAYDGQVFNIALSDVPERKDDLVSGRYELPAPGGPTTVAVKIIDMLGEEVLVTAEV
jgi:DNA modification methylase